MIIHATKSFIQTKPRFYSLALRMGYDIENGDINEAHVLHQLGKEIENFEFSPGERFIIEDDKSETYIITNGNQYKPLCKFEFCSFLESFLESDYIINLEPGEYLFHKDGMTLEFVDFISDEEQNEDSL